MSSPRMAAADAQFLWLSDKVPNDSFLLYGFDGTPRDGALEEVRRNAEACDAVCVRVVDDDEWRYPRWVRAEVTPEQFVVHDERWPPGHWPPDPLDVTRMAWRVHQFPDGVVVVQMSHALGDGRRGSALAGALLGRSAPIPPVTPDRGFFPWRVVRAALAHRGSAPPTPPRPALSVNARPSGTPALRTVVIERQRLRGPTVTVGALTAIAEALGGYLTERGEDVGNLAAEVPMAKPGPPTANNNFRNVTVGLYPDLPREQRAHRIAADIAGHRRRAAGPAALTSDAAFAAVPARLLRWGVGHFDPDARSTTVAGNTVVSSVDRGRADLSFSGATVRFTAGFPALSPMMSLTHGVHGIGGTVAVSVHADPVNVDVADYLDRLTHALGLQS